MHAPLRLRRAPAEEGTQSDRADRRLVRGSARVLAAGLVCALAATAHAQTVGAPAEPEKLPQARTLGSGAWSYFGDPRAICTAFGCYAGWATPSGRVQIARIGPTKASTFTLDADLGKPDDHNNPSLVASRAGAITAFWSPHSGRFFPVSSDKPSRIYYRSQRGSGGLSFGPTRSIPRPADCRLGYTYPNALRYRGMVFLFVRGCTWQPTLMLRKNGHWARRGRVVVQGDGGMRPYAKYATDHRTVLMAFTGCHVASCPHNSLYYVQYRNGYWTQANGSRIARMSRLPFRPRATGEPIYDGAVQGGRAWVQDVAFTRAGAPVVLYTVAPSRGGHSTYWYATYTDGSWHRNVIPFGSTNTTNPGGATLDHETPNVAYVSRKIGDRNQITLVMTPDGGATWYERQMTTGSQSSIRPMSPRGDPGFSILWVFGRRLTYRRFHTTIRYQPLGDTTALRSSLRRLRPPGR